MTEPLRMCFHGTDASAAAEILRSGFIGKNSYFATHLEDALEFGGPYIFFAVFADDRVFGWQFCWPRRLSMDRVAELRIYSSTSVFKVQSLLDEVEASND